MRHLPRALLTLCALLIFAAAAPTARAAQAAPITSNIIQYIPEEDWDDSGLSQQEKEDQAHTIHWLTGIKPPVMPHELIERDRTALGAFTALEEKNDKGEVTHRYYASPYVPGNGWYDINKYVSEKGGGIDSHLCFAVSMTNLLHWWLDQNRSYVEEYISKLPPERGAELTAYLNNMIKDDEGTQAAQAVLQHPSTSRLYNDVILPAYRNAESGGYPDKPADLFFNGYSPSKDQSDRNRPDAFPNKDKPSEKPHTPGGLFSSVFGKSILTDSVRNGHYDQLDRDLARDMDTGIGVILAYDTMGGAHAVTVWGAEYDENDKLCAVYLVDNNDTGGAGPGTSVEGKLVAMMRYQVVKSNGPAAYISTKVDNSAKDGRTFINSYYFLTLAREGWEAWEKTGEPCYADGRAFLHPIRDTIHCEHTYSFSARGSQIVRTCTKCGIEDWVGIRLRDQEPIIYNGQKQKPCVTVSSMGGTYPFIPNEITYVDNQDAGTATAKMSYRDGDQLHTAKLSFTILPRPADAPQAAPELLSSTAYSISVKAVPGLEYSLDGENWRADGCFYDLTPNTSYHVSVRTAAPGGKNDTHSEPCSETLLVTTADGDLLGDPDWSIDPLEPDAVTVVNTGRRDRVTLVIAGYDARGRQSFLQMQELVGGAGETLRVSFTDTSALHRAFLLNDHFSPAI